MDNTGPVSRKKVFALGAGALAGVLALGGVAVAGGHGHFGRPGGPLAIMGLVQGLDLNDQQELQAIKIRKNLAAQGREIHKDMKVPMSQVLDELEKPAPDAAKVHAVADQALQRFSKVVHSGIDQFLALHATFTPEQREKLVTRGREMQNHHHDRPGKAGAPGAPEPSDE